MTIVQNPARRAESAVWPRVPRDANDSISFRDLPPENPHLLSTRPANPAGRVNVQNLGLRRVPLTKPVGTVAWRHTDWLGLRVAAGAIVAEVAV